jgi:fatty-acyl-CoA synthase
VYVTVADIFEQSVLKYPYKEAIVDVQKQVRWTYSEWDGNVNRLANAMLDAGIRKGDCVSAFLYNGVEFATVYFACAKIGALFNPINFRLKADELSYILQDAGTRLLIYEKALAEVVNSVAKRHSEVQYWLTDPDPGDEAVAYQEQILRMSSERPQAEVSEQDLYAIMYSSGTTGRPKGVLHRHREVIEQSMAVIGVMKYSESDRGLVAGPLFHCGELHSGFFARVHVGATNVIMQRFNALKALQLIHEEKITMVGAVPTAWKMMLEQDLSPYDLSSLRIGMFGGESMPPGVIRQCLDTFGIDMVQAYGMTEMGPGIAYLPFPRHCPPLHKAGAAGKAVLNHEIRVVRMKEDGPSEPDEQLPVGEIGEIIVRGNGMMTGYHNREEATRDALYRGWFHTGDLGYIDADGYLWIVDRKNNMIVSGGENIYPREVEHVLIEHPAVKDAAVVGTPDSKWGETVVAFIVTGEERVTEEELDRFCREKMAGYKRPRKYRFIEELPRNSAGKVLHHVLKEMARTQG